MTQPKRATPTIALAMIVKNESAVIERCIDSVLPIITSWVIVDTGSTDDTPAVIERALADRPGTLHRRPWQNFGHNRTELMQLARGAADYLLLVDADMTVRIDGPLPELTADCYLLHHAGTLDYAVPRLVRGDLPWRFEGATHEYLACDCDHGDAVLDQLVIEHHADGGARSDKFERDRTLLEAALLENPDDGRTVFYLAQTYADLGETERAIELYRRRVALGGWAEEAFCAQQRIAELLADRDWGAAVPEFLHAWQIRPSRAEPLYHLARGYRSREEFHLAHHFAQAGLAIPYPDDRLFVQRDPYDWGLLFEYAIAAHWVGNPRAAVEANEQLLTRGVPGWVESWVRHNLGWSLQAVGRADAEAGLRGPEIGPLAPDAHGELPLSALAPGVRTSALEPDLGDAWPSTPDDGGRPVYWPAFNPSIATDGDGFRLVFRTSNYWLTPGGHYEQIGGDYPIRTINHLLSLDADLALREVRTLTEVPPGAATFTSLVHGCEDARPIEVDGQWYAVATVRDRNPAELCEMAWMRLTPGDESIQLLRSDRTEPHQHEKNWMPFLVDGRLHLLYACAPTVVLAADPRTAEVHEVSVHAAPASCTHLRGGSQGVEIDGRWYFVAHEASGYGPTRRYVHRVVRLARSGDTFAIDGVSPRFTFTGAKVEFCAGLAVLGDEAVLSFGVDDARPMVARLPVAQFAALVEPD